MLKEPEKPEHYTRDHFLIFAAALLIMAILFVFGAPRYYITTIPLIFVIAFSAWWFREYNNKKQQHHQEFISQWQGSNERSVNENIAAYEKLQKEKKAKAKCWQFWV